MNFNESSIKMQNFSFKKMDLKMPSAFCFCINESSGQLYVGALEQSQWLIYQGYNDALTHWGRDKMAAILQTTFSNAVSWMKVYEFRLIFHWGLFLRFKLTIFQYWFRKWLGADQTTSHYLNQWWLVYWRIYASLGLNELTHWPLTDVAVISN